MKNIFKTFIIALLALFVSGCDYLDITPMGQVIPTKSSEYRALINSAYNIFPRHKVLLNMRGTHYDPQDDPWGMGLDGFDMFKDIYTWNDLNPDHGKTQEYPYMTFYRVIFYANEIIANGGDAFQDTDESMDQIIGEAHALRAYVYFELANMYAPVYEKGSASSVKAVPVTTEIDVEQEFPRATLQEVYDLILSDLDAAGKLMDVQRVSGFDKFRFSLESLYALESRVYLYMGEWQKSLDASERVLEVSSQLEDLNDPAHTVVTDYRSMEAIMSLEYVSSIELRDYAAISGSLLGLYDDGDLRPADYFAESWYGYMIANKMGSENERVSFRRGEIYLNAAEAAAHLGQDVLARSYMQTLLQHRYDSEGYSVAFERLSLLSGDALVAGILVEREKELALEGHEWYDLRRTTQPAFTKIVKWEEYSLEKNDARYTLQFPRSAREANPLLN